MKLPGRLSLAVGKHSHRTTGPGVDLAVKIWIRSKLVRFGMIWIKHLPRQSPHWIWLPSALLPLMSAYVTFAPTTTRFLGEETDARGLLGSRMHEEREAGCTPESGPQEIEEQERDPDGHFPRPIEE